MKEEWLFPGAVVPVDIKTTAALVVEIRRLIDVVGGMVLAQSEQDCVGWFGYDTGVGAWFETNKGDDDSIPLYKEPPQRTWVGLTKEEINQGLLRSFYVLEKARAWRDGVAWAEEILKEKNNATHT